MATVPASPADGLRSFAWLGGQTSGGRCTEPEPTASEMMGSVPLCSSTSRAKVSSITILVTAGASGCAGSVRPSHPNRAVAPASRSGASKTGTGVGIAPATNEHPVRQMQTHPAPASAIARALRIGRSPASAEGRFRSIARLASNALRVGESRVEHARSRQCGRAQPPHAPARDERGGPLRRQHHRIKERHVRRHPHLRREIVRDVVGHGERLGPPRRPAEASLDQMGDDLRDMAAILEGKGQGDVQVEHDGQDLVVRGTACASM